MPGKGHWLQPGATGNRKSAQGGTGPSSGLGSLLLASLPGKPVHPSDAPDPERLHSRGRARCSVCRQTLPSRPTRWPEPAAGTGPGGRRAKLHLCLALMCICRPFRLEARCPHSSHTNSFSPRCLKASWSCSSVRVRKHLSQVGH